jgi:hypothetical protein
MARLTGKMKIMVSDAAQHTLASTTAGTHLNGVRRSHQNITAAVTIISVVTTEKKMVADAICGTKCRA